mmetsp:Transcript_55699/g.124428  ORF Transcript_55699/g.124428 Transcript_55699/m.124428 type:complete len:299 (+) Transcript_55699:2511-3407(+)
MLVASSSSSTATSSTSISSMNSAILFSSTPKAASLLANVCITPLLRMAFIFLLYLVLAILTHSRTKSRRLVWSMCATLTFASADAFIMFCKISTIIFFTSRGEPSRGACFRWSLVWRTIRTKWSRAFSCSTSAAPSLTASTFLPSSASLAFSLIACPSLPITVLASNSWLGTPSGSRIYSWAECMSSIMKLVLSTAVRSAFSAARSFLPNPSDAVPGRAPSSVFDLLRAYFTRLGLSSSSVYSNPLELASAGASLFSELRMVARPGSVSVLLPSGSPFLGFLGRRAFSRATRALAPGA